MILYEAATPDSSPEEAATEAISVSAAAKKPQPEKYLFYLYRNSGIRQPL